jgi:hypothetical protein
MRKFFAVTIAFSLLFLGLTFGIAKAQISHGFEDSKFAAEKPWTNIREHGQSMYDRGKMLKEMGEKMMAEGMSMIKEADANIWKEGGPGGPKGAPKKQ